MSQKVGLEVGVLRDLHRVDNMADLHPGRDRLVLQAVLPDVLAVHGELTIEVGEEGELSVDGGAPGVSVVDPVVDELRAGLHYTLPPRDHLRAVWDEVLAVLGGEALRIVSPEHQPQLDVAQVVPAASWQRPQHGHIQGLPAALEAPRPLFPHHTAPGQEEEQQGRKVRHRAMAGGELHLGSLLRLSSSRVGVAEGEFSAWEPMLSEPQGSDSAHLKPLPGSSPEVFRGKNGRQVSYQKQQGE